MLGREVVEREQRFPILGEAGSGLVVFGLVLGKEAVEGFLRVSTPTYAKSLHSQRHLLPMAGYVACPAEFLRIRVRRAEAAVGSPCVMKVIFGGRRNSLKPAQDIIGIGVCRVHGKIFH